MNRLQFLFTHITGFTPSGPVCRIFSEYFDAKTEEDKIFLISYAAKDLFIQMSQDDVEKVHEAIQMAYDRAYRFLGTE